MKESNNEKIIKNNNYNDKFTTNIYIDEFTNNNNIENNNIENNNIYNNITNESEEYILFLIINIFINLD